MIRTSRQIVAGAALLLIACAPLAAQQPLGTGTAAVRGSTAVTEARRADAILWNPALVGIWEGPRSSYSFLSLDVARAPSGSWVGDASSYELLGRADALAGSGLFDALVPGDASAPGMSAGVTWGAFQAEDLALALSSHFTAGAEVPEGLDGLTGDWANGVEPAVSFRSSATVLALSKGTFAELPVLGASWFGATAKGTWVHSYARGGFGAGGPVIDGGQYACPEADLRPFHCEAAFQNVPGYGVDLGVAFAPSETVKLGASLQNAFSGFLRSRDNAEVAYWSSEGRRERPVSDAADAGTPAYRLAEAVWDDMAFPAVVRAGASVKTSYGTVAGALTEIVRSGGLQPDWTVTDRYSASYQGPQGMPVRLMGALGDDAYEVGAGIEFGGCDRRWVAGLGRRDSDLGGVSYSLNVSLTFTDMFCQQPR